MDSFFLGLYTLVLKVTSKQITTDTLRDDEVRIKKGKDKNIKLYHFQVYLILACMAEMSLFLTFNLFTFLDEIMYLDIYTLMILRYVAFLNESRTMTLVFSSISTLIFTITLIRGLLVSGTFDWTKFKNFEVKNSIADLWRAQVLVFRDLQYFNSHHDYHRCNTRLEMPKTISRTVTSF